MSSSSMGFIGGGGDGDIYRVGPREVVKIQHNWDDPQLAILTAENNERERLFCEMIVHHPNEHLVRILNPRATDGLHMEEMTGGSLESQLLHHSHFTSGFQKIRWIEDIMHAVVFLWNLGYIHGDLRPPNILFNDEGLIRLCDFGGTVKIGALLVVRHIPFWDGHCEEAGIGSEQFALASLFYNIITGSPPFSDVEAYDIFDLIDNEQFPTVCGKNFKGFERLVLIIQKGWNLEYESMDDLKVEVFAACEALRTSSS
jgi:serine/threonine protein kinase